MNKLLSILAAAGLCLSLGACMMPEGYDFSRPVVPDLSDTAASSPNEPSPDYHWLTKTEFDTLAAQKTEYQSLTPAQQKLARESGIVGCPDFIHAWWETSIAIPLIREVGEAEFDRWENARMQAGECCSIYDMAVEFGLDYQTLLAVIERNSLLDLYPPQRLKMRFSYFDLPLEPEVDEQSTEQVLSAPPLPLEQLAQSVSYDPQLGELVFTIPELPADQLLSLTVSGRTPQAELSGENWRALEVETATYDWIAGETYTVQTDAEELEYILLRANLVQRDTPVLPAADALILRIGSNGEISRDA